MISNRKSGADARIDVDNGLVFVQGIVFPSREAAEDVGYSFSEIELGPKLPGNSEGHKNPNPLENVSDYILERARFITQLQRGKRKEYVPKKELLQRLRSLRDIEFPLPYEMKDYRVMCSSRLYHEFQNLRESLFR